MTSPFKTYQEFNEAEGPIYTFANHPTLIGILIAISAFIFLYFLYSTFNLRKGASEGTNPLLISLLLLASSLPLVGSLAARWQPQESRSVVQVAQAETPRGSVPFSTNLLSSAVLLGMVRTAKSRRPRQRSSYRRGDRLRHLR